KSRGNRDHPRAPNPGATEPRRLSHRNERAERSEGFERPIGLLLDLAGGRGASTSGTPSLTSLFPRGLFFDYATVHLLTTATLERLHQLYPQGRFEVPRFRPNIVVATASREPDFIENGWIGHTIAIGDSVLLAVTGTCGRCVRTTLAQGGLPRDRGAGNSRQIRGLRLQRRQSGRLYRLVESGDRWGEKQRRQPARHSRFRVREGICGRTDPPRRSLPLPRRDGA